MLQTTSSVKILAKESYNYKNSNNNKMIERFTIDMMSEDELLYFSIKPRSSLMDDMLAGRLMTGFASSSIAVLPLASF